jgi:hypothetical protein
MVSSNRARFEREKLATPLDVDRNSMTAMTTVPGGPGESAGV